MLLPSHELRWLDFLGRGAIASVGLSLREGCVCRTGDPFSDRVLYPVLTQPPQWRLGRFLGEVLYKRLSRAGEDNLEERSAPSRNDRTFE